MCRWIRDCFCAWCVYCDKVALFVQCAHVNVVVCGCLVVIIGLPCFVLRRRLYLELVVRSTSRSGGGCIRERVNCLCLCLACV